MRKKLIIICCVTALMSIFAICGILFIDVDHPSATIVQQNTTQTNSTHSIFHIPTQSNEQHENKKTNTYTTKALFTAPRYADETKEAQNKTSLSQHIAHIKTTRAATKEELEMLYDLAYNKVMSQYYNYETALIKQSAYINSIEAKISPLQKQARELYSNYILQQQILKEEFADKGLLNSGVHTRALKDLESQYKADLAPITEQLDKLEKELKNAKEQYNSDLKNKPTKAQLDASIHEVYLVAVKEFQENLSS